MCVCWQSTHAVTTASTAFQLVPPLVRVRGGPGTALAHSCGSRSLVCHIAALARAIRICASTHTSVCDSMAHSFAPAGRGFSSWGCVSSSLTSLTLTGCSKLTDEGLAALAAVLGPQLQDLGLPGCRGVTDAGVGALQVATNLRTLNLASNKGLSGRCVVLCLWSSIAYFSVNP